MNFFSLKKHKLQPHHTTGIMRECAFKAGLTTTLFSTNLEFTTERMYNYFIYFISIELCFY